MSTSKLHPWGGTVLHCGHSGWLNCRSRSSTVTVARCCSGTARMSAKPVASRGCSPHDTRLDLSGPSTARELAKWNLLLEHDFPKLYIFPEMPRWIIAHSSRRLPSLSRKLVSSVSGRHSFLMVNSPLPEL